MLIVGGKLVSDELFLVNTEETEGDNYPFRQVIIKFS